jgi:hypothetical protein
LVYCFPQGFIYLLLLLSLVTSFISATKKFITENDFKQIARYKLKLADSGDTKELVKAKSESTPGNDGKAYKLTKTLGIKYCTDLISHLPDWLKHFNSHKKRDDLADSFIMTLHYFEKNNLAKLNQINKKNIKLV